MLNFVSLLIIPIFIFIVFYLFFKDAITDFSNYYNILLTFYSFSIALISFDFYKKFYKELKETNNESFIFTILIFLIINILYIDILGDQNFKYIPFIIVYIAILFSIWNPISFIMDKKNRDIENNSSKEDLKAELENIFSRYHKKESLNLLKKFNKIDNSIISNDNNIKDIFGKLKTIFEMKKYIEALHIFHDAIINITLENTSNDKFNKIKDKLATLIYDIKQVYYQNIIKKFKKLAKIIVQIHFYISVLYLIFSIILFSLDLKFRALNGLIFIYSIFIIVLSPIVGAIIFFNFKHSALEKYIDTKHSSLNVFYQNFKYLILSFTVIITIFLFGLLSISTSGKEFSYLIKLFSSLIFQTFTIENFQDVINLLCNGIKQYIESPNCDSTILSNIIDIIIFMKILLILLISSVIYILIKYLLEVYKEVIEDSKKYYFSMPSQFIKFFSYITLSLFTIIVIYGTLFINYPNLKNEAKFYECKERNGSCQIEFKKNTVAFINDSNHSIIINNQSEKDSSSSIIDYLPLSMFITLFGAVLMMSSRDLLENYFTGLSLKIDSPYEERELVKLDNDKALLKVENIGFRATTFYDIENNSHITISHKKLMSMKISNYTKPTLDYRRKIEITIPSEFKKTEKIKLMKMEKLLLLATYLSRGIKFPKIDLNKIEEDIDKLKDDIDIDLINNILEKNNNTRNLFIYQIYKEIKSGGNDSYKDDKSIKSIYKIIKAIILTLKDAQSLKEKIENLEESNNYGIKRIYNSLYDAKDKDKWKIYSEQLGNHLIKISYYYFLLADQIWELKEKTGSEQKRVILDNALLEILDVPRVTSQNLIKADKYYWKMTLSITVELAEQSDEIIHHINMFVESLYDLIKNNSYIHKR